MGTSSKGRLVKSCYRYGEKCIAFSEKRKCPIVAIYSTIFQAKHSLDNILPVSFLASVVWQIFFLQTVV